MSIATMSIATGTHWNNTPRRMGLLAVALAAVFACGPTTPALAGGLRGKETAGHPKNYQALFGSGQTERRTTPGGAVDFGPNPSKRAYRQQNPESSPAFPRHPGGYANDSENWDNPATSTPVAPSPANPHYQDRPQPEPKSVPRHEHELTGRELIDAHLTGRYGDPVVLRFINGTSLTRFGQLVLETSRLIDSRHITPSPYRERVAQAVENLSVALDNPQFVRAFGLQSSPTQEQAFLSEVDRLLAGTSVQNVNDMLRVMRSVAAIAQRQLGLPRKAVAAEFVYGAVESLDKYSAFNPEAPVRPPSASTGLEGNVVGIGVEIKPNDRGVIVVQPVRNSPAASAGLQPGDIITAVNGESLAGQTLAFAADRIGGPVGSQARLRVLRDGQALTFTIRRDHVKTYSVSNVRMIDPVHKIGYIKLKKFAATSTEQMKKALWDLYGQGMKSLVIDLRGNPGGLLTTAISLSDLFLPRGTIVSTRGRTPEDDMHKVAHFPKTWKVPLVVLVDGMSASAAEIFSAAIQENDRGIIVGRLTYGKGTVQTHFPLQTINGNLKITTARFYSPDGRKMAGAGVTPDVIVPDQTPDDEVVPLQEDPDVQKALQVAAGDQVRQLAEASENGVSLSQR